MPTGSDRFLLAQESEPEPAGDDDGDDDDDDDDDRPSAAATLRYASFELSGGSTLKLRVVGAVTDPDVAERGLRDDHVKEMVEDLKGQATIKRLDAQAVEIVVTFPRSTLAERVGR